jgi:hypothetical protein
MRPRRMCLPLAHHPMPPTWVPPLPPLLSAALTAAVALAASAAEAKESGLASGAQPMRLTSRPAGASMERMRREISELPLLPLAAPEGGSDDCALLATVCGRRRDTGLAGELLSLPPPLPAAVAPSRLAREAWLLLCAPAGRLPPRAATQLSSWDRQGLPLPRPASTGAAATIM